MGRIKYFVIFIVVILLCQNDKLYSGQNSSDPVIITGLIYSLVTATLGGFLGWILIHCVNQYLRKRKLCAYLVIVINNLLDKYQDDRTYIRRVQRNYLKLNYAVKHGPTYFKEDFCEIECQWNFIFEHLNKAMIESLTKFVMLAKEVEILLEGFANALTRYRIRGQPLNDQDLRYFGEKIDRINSILEKFPPNISELDRLPKKYSGIVPASSHVTEGSAHSDI